MLTRNRIARIIVAVLLATGMLWVDASVARGRGGARGGFAGGGGGGGSNRGWGGGNYPAYGRSGQMQPNVAAQRSGGVPNNWNRRQPANPPGPAQTQQQPAPVRSTARNYGGWNTPYVNRTPNYGTTPQTPAARPAPPTATPVARTAPPKPTPVQNTKVAEAPSPQETIAEKVYDQTRLAAWEMYRHYTDSPGYSDAYRELHGLMKLAKTISRELVTGNAPKNDAALEAALFEAEVMLQVVRLQSGDWQRDTDAGPPGKAGDLHMQLKGMVESLTKLMKSADVECQIFSTAEVDAATPIRARK